MSFKEWRERRELKKQGMEIIPGEKPEPKPVENKPSFRQRVDTKLTQAGEKYKDYKSKAPERQAAKLVKMQTQSKMLDAKASIMQKKQKIFAAKQQGMQQMMGGSMNSSPFGQTQSQMKMPSMGTGMFPGQPTTKTTRKKTTRKKSKKRKSKGKGSKTIVIRV